jgi:HlyD family secretion protein
MMRARFASWLGKKGENMVCRAAYWLVAVVAVLATSACMNTGEPEYQGWAEADLIFVAPDEAGRVQTLSVREGDAVATGQALFAIDDDLQRADIKQAQAALTNALQVFQRAEQLLKTSSGSQAAYDNAQATLREAEARLNASETRLARRKVASAAKGTVQRVYFRPGEMVASGRPVVSILPPENIKVRFYVPQSALPGCSHGQTVILKCDGCANAGTARISYIADSAEFTPPVIYSLEERAKLVFLIEARPDHPENLRVGQPVSVVVPKAAVAEAKK